MNTKLLHRLAAACLLMLPALAAQANDCLPTFEDGWVRLAPAGRPMAAGFGTLHNRCKAPVVVVGASSPAYAAVELHETRVVDGVGRMRHLPALEIKAGGSATLAPGGTHIMLMQPVAAPQAGGKVELTLRLADGRTVTLALPVRAAGDAAAGHAHAH